MLFVMMCRSESLKPATFAQLRRVIQWHMLLLHSKHSLSANLMNILYYDKITIEIAMGH